MSERVMDLRNSYDPATDEPVATHVLAQLEPCMKRNVMGTPDEPKALCVKYPDSDQRGWCRNCLGDGTRAQINRAAPRVVREPRICAMGDYVWDEVESDA